jgi:hypothetical protein
LPAEQHNGDEPQMRNLLAKTACRSDHTSARDPQAFGAIRIRIIHVNISQELSSINMVAAEPQLDLSRLGVENHNRKLEKPE